MNVKQARKKGSRANLASTLAKGLVPEKWQQFPKGKSHGERGDRGRWRSKRSHIGASSLEARSGLVRQAESPLQAVGVRDAVGGGARPRALAGGKAVMDVLHWRHGERWGIDGVMPVNRGRRW